MRGNPRYDRHTQADTMRLDEAHPLNLGVLRYLSRRGGKQAAIAASDSVKDPYMSQGSHPDVVERVWKTLGAGLPVDCRRIVYGTPALVEPASGVVFAFCLGTAYCLRLTPHDYEEALKLGRKTIQRWSPGHVTDMRQELGPDWIIGSWLADEIRWCAAVYAGLKKSAEDGGEGRT